MYSKSFSVAAAALVASTSATVTAQTLIIEPSSPNLIMPTCARCGFDIRRRRRAGWDNCLRHQPRYARIPSNSVRYQTHSKELA